jgi:hypothetical protein
VFSVDGSWLVTAMPANIRRHRILHAADGLPVRPPLTYGDVASSRINSELGTEPAKDVDAPAMNLTGSPACARVMNSICPSGRISTITNAESGLSDSRSIGRRERMCVLHAHDARQRMPSPAKG